MKTIHVGLKENSYKIIIGYRVLSKLGAVLDKKGLGSEAVIITNPSIARRYAGTIKTSLKKRGIAATVFLVPEGEGSKSVKTAFGLIERIARFSALKKPFIVALGGGVIGDLAGYVAAAYRRGVPYIQVPTTFLAQIDSAIGGKVGIDLPCGKNLVGAFYQPKLVFSDVACLSSLPVRQIRNGLAEAIKYGMIDDAGLFAFIEKDFQKLLGADMDKLGQLVYRCSRIKARVVMADEKETKGIRSILNFGHTIGHAIEASGKYRSYQHGEAIALGMKIAADISVQMGCLSSSHKERLNTLVAQVGLPTKLKKISTAKILKAMRHDKKFLAGQNRFVLASRVGSVKLVTGVPRRVIEKAINNCR